MKKFFNFPILFFFIVVFLFFNPFFLQGKIPIPADTIIGLYHPFRDSYASEYPNGIPFKNFLVTDPVRQQYPWRELAISLEKKGQLPTWNPYNFSGTPLLANFQTAAFYPLNILFFILPFSLSWNILIILQPLLAGLFLYFYLRFMRLSKVASVFGGIVFALCGFSTAWLEWGNVVSTGLWLPLMLLSIDKIFHWLNNSSKLQFKIQNYFVWLFIFTFSLCSSLFAGHLQIFFYVFIVSVLYFFIRWMQVGRSIKTLILFLILASCFLILTAIQWLPTLQLINSSARNIDQMNWQQINGWFIPWQHLIQFIAPDFFGNPTTLNYWGVWNYGEFIGYIGIIPLTLSLFAIFFRRDKKTLFFTLIFILSLIFSLPTILAKLPYILNIPFLSTSQPTRLLFLTDFSLAVLAALGFDVLIRKQKIKQIFFPILFVGFIFTLLWTFVFFGQIYITGISAENIEIAKRNLILPTVFFTIGSVLIIRMCLPHTNLVWVKVGVLLLFALTAFDLIRFGQKFTPFTNSEYLFPSTKIISYLQRDNEQFRIMTTDSHIFPPNFSAIYKLQSIDGYDPLYLRRYAELIASSERRRPDISPPFGFNRIITPSNANSQIMDLMGVKYVLSFSELPSPKFTKVFEEGQTKIYINNDVLPRVFFVKEIKLTNNKQETINSLFNQTLNLKTTAIVESSPLTSSSFSLGEVEISEYSENKIIINTKNQGDGFLVFTDTFYPTWHAKICTFDRKNCQETKIYLTDYNFRGIIVPTGNHHIIFYNTLL